MADKSKADRWERLKGQQPLTSHTIECQTLVVHGDVDLRRPSENYLVVERDVYDVGSIYESSPRATERQEALDYLLALPQEMPVLILTPRSAAEMNAVREFTRLVHADFVGPGGSKWEEVSRMKLQEMETWAKANIGEDLPRVPPDPPMGEEETDEPG
jgi:hypothetical protein